MTKSPKTNSSIQFDSAQIRQMAQDLRLYGILENWGAVMTDNTLYEAASRLVAWEHDERNRRRLVARERATRLHRYGSISAVTNYDWSWPERIDRAQIEELLRLDFVKSHENIVFVGPVGVGKTMFTKNLISFAAHQGYRALFIEASELLDDLLVQESRVALRRAIDKYARPDLLAIDEIGYLSYDTRHADLLFQVINRRAGRKSTILTTNRPFKEWNEVFPNAACVTALIDRLIERCEVVQIQAKTWRGKSFQQRQSTRDKKRRRLDSMESTPTDKKVTTESNGG